MSHANLSDTEFNAKMQIRVPYLLTPANASRMLIIPADTGALGVSFANWNLFFPLTQSGTTNTTANTDDKNHWRDVLDHDIMRIRASVPVNVLTTADRETMDWQVRDDEPTPIVQATYPPTITHEKSIHGKSTFRIKDPNNPTSQKMPHGQKVLLLYGIGEKGLEEPAVNFNHAELVSRFLKDLDFDAADEGKYCYVQGQYINTHGKKGPKSSPLLRVLIM